MDRRFEEEIAGSDDVFPGSEDVLFANSTDITDEASPDAGDAVVRAPSAAAA
jgi:hypothetical protein